MTERTIISKYLYARIDIILLILILLSALFLHIGWGIKLELPDYPQIDEPAFVVPAVRMAAEASLNPKSFKHPGSTIIYPLMVMYRLRNFLAHNDALFKKMPGIAADFELNSSGYYLLGRSLSIFYSMMSILLVYLLGVRAFNRQVGLLGAWFTSICWLSIRWALLVRTDSATTCFGLIALYLCVRFYQRPQWSALLLGGASIGLAIATKYSMIPMVAVLLLANIFLFLKGRWNKTQLAGAIILSLAAVVLAFTITTPYFLVEFKVAISNIEEEMRPFHLGADGLSPLGNLSWYLGKALPIKLGWPRLLLAAAGAVYILIERNYTRLLVLVYPLIFIAGISYSALHWSRWLIPILPILSLLSARAIIGAGSWIKSELPFGKPLAMLFLAVSVSAISYVPLRETVYNNIRQSRPSTKILAQKWLEKNIPEGALIAREAYTPHSENIPGREVFNYRLSYKPLEWYRSQGVQYIITSSQTFNRYFAEPERYSKETSFYHQLFDEGELLAEFSRSEFHNTGHIIRIYRLGL